MLSQSLHSLSHALMSATHPVNLPTARGTSSTEVLRYTWQSSAYMCRSRPWRTTICSSSACKAHTAVDQAPTLVGRQMVRVMSATGNRSTKPAAFHQVQFEQCRYETAVCTEEQYSSDQIRLLTRSTVCRAQCSQKPLRGQANRRLQPPAHQPMSVYQTRRATSLFQLSASVCTLTDDGAADHSQTGKH